MRQATATDRLLVIKIISEAFYDNNSVNYVIRQGDEKNNKRRIKALVDYAYKVCLDFGEIWLEDDGRGCLMFLNPHAKKASMKTVLWDLQLAFHCMGIWKIPKVLKRESLIKGNHPKTAFLHLWFIGVLPGHQGKGIGTELLKVILNKSKTDGLSIYLETSVPANVKWYLQHNFKVYKKLRFDNHMLYLLKKIHDSNV